MDNKTLIIHAKDMIGFEFNSELSFANPSNDNLQYLNSYTDENTDSLSKLEIEIAERLHSTALNTTIVAISQRLILHSDYRNVLLSEIERKINEARIANSDETSIDIQLAEQMLALLEQSFETMNNEANRDNVFNYISLVVYTIHTHIPIVTNISFSVA